MAERILHPVSIGDKFGRWIVLAAAPSRFYTDASGKYRSEHRRWLCQCHCGTKREVAEAAIRNGMSTSCGCYNRERSIAANKTHGEVVGGKATPEYHTWQAMLDRCRNPRNKRYADYGARGISVCPRWHAFENFLVDMGRRPSSRHSLDREKNELGYFPENCRWALPGEQMTNRRNTRFIEIDGQSIPLADLAKKYEIPANTLRFRILKGWDLQEALTKPVRPKAKVA